MRGRRLFIFSLLMSLWLGTPGVPLLAQTQGPEAVLGGLTTVYPVIRYTEDGLTQPVGAARRQIQSDAERLLADAGLNIVDSSEFDRLLGARNFPLALLELEVRISKHPESDLKNYLLSLQIKQAVFLTRKPVVRFLATTWESMAFGAAKDLPFVQGVAKDAMGRFIQEWNAQNAK
jgi:hypothetical protein